MSLTPREEKLYLLASAKTRARAAEEMLRETASDLKVALGVCPPELAAAVRASRALTDAVFRAISELKK